MSAPLRVDHTSIFVPESKLDDVVKFLLASLGHMGLKEFMRPYPRLVGLGHQTAFFWIGALPPEDVDEKTCCLAAMEAGGIDNGKPGIREVYHKNYYAAFVRDPFLGIGWEVVNHASGL
ncbi:hypothetical protein KVT40_002690 [Elsinoe batatas]|uniref:VOC domain-containing protein n=1 Tax=Elsinoe batatas TaxID=2601811 RepID=A0A8K0L7C1_9PEZI|nr:hypothetical protein KVT40_002690 [Elsinoe batatas]